VTFDSRESSVHDGRPLECYRISRGATVYQWTSAAAPVTIPQGVFTPAAIARGDLDFSQEEGSGWLEVTVALDNPLVDQFVPYIPDAAVVVAVFRAHAGEEALAQPVFLGTVVSVAVKGDRAVLTCAPFGEALKKMVPGVTYQPLCAWALYGPGCGVLVANFTDQCVVEAVSGVTVTSPDFAARPDGWYRNGWLTDPAGDVRMVVAHLSNVVTLMNPYAALAAGQTVGATAGCDRQPATCVGKFNNFARFMGFPWIPARNPFVGTVG